jgi:hypothetical protein
MGIAPIIEKICNIITFSVDIAGEAFLYSRPLREHLSGAQGETE